MNWRSAIWTAEWPSPLTVAVPLNGSRSTTTSGGGWTGGSLNSPITGIGRVGTAADSISFSFFL